MGRRSKKCPQQLRLRWKSQCLRRGRQRSTTRTLRSQKTKLVPKKRRMYPKLSPTCVVENAGGAKGDDENVKKKKAEEEAIINTKARAEKDVQKDGVEAKQSKEAR